MLKEKQNKTIINYLNPSYIYIPINNITDINQQYVYKLDLISEDNEISYFPISGTPKGYTTKLNSKNHKKTYLKIQNDFKEKTIYQKNYKVNYLKNIKKENLIINAYDLEPSSTYNSTIIQNYCEELLATIDYILDKLHIKKATIIVKDQDELILNNYLGTYYNIEIGKFHHQTNITLTTIYNIYQYLKYQKPVITKIVNIITPNHNLNIKVKIGTLLKDIMNKFNLYQDINPTYLLVVNSRINGSSISTDELVITPDINAIIFIKNNFAKTAECINCEKCSQICPLNLIPVYIMKYSSNINKLKKLSVDKCIECGLCSFICPSKIEIEEHIKIAKEKVGTWNSK